MDPGDEHFLIIGTVENADASALGQVAGGSPQKVVLQLLRAGVLKAEYLAALRIHARHDMADSAVFARRVHGLKDQQQCVAV